MFFQTLLCIIFGRHIVKKSDERRTSWVSGDHVPTVSYRCSHCRLWYVRS